VHAYAGSGSSARDRAFERLYRRYVSDVYRYTLALLRNPADAEDITQTTFLNAYRAYKRGEEPLKPQNWLIKIAHNACRTRYLRASRRPVEVPLDQSLRELAVPVDDIPDIKAVLDALAKLPFNQRAALVMRELEGRSYAEIAQALDVSVPAVETLIFRARRSLRVRHAALRKLAVLPLPASLSSFSGGGAAVGGGAILGSGLLLKAVFAVGVGVVAGTAGPTVQAKVLAPQGQVNVPHKPALAVESGSASSAPARPRAKVSIVATEARKAIAVAGTELARRDGAPAALPRGDRPTSSPGGVQGSSGAVAAPASAAGSGQPASSASSPAPSAVTETVEKTVPIPAVAVPPVQAPALPAPISTPQAPSVPVPVAPPALPPPPPLPPPPSLP
jgi:RNA polymerase sigma factor (sigma-70 family)